MLSLMLSNTHGGCRHCGRDCHIFDALGLTHQHLACICIGLGLFALSINMRSLDRNMLDRTRMSGIRDNVEEPIDY